MPVLDVYTSLVAISFVAWLGGLVATVFHLPRIVLMIVFGILLYPSLHPSILQTGVSPPGYDFSVSGGAQNPASSIRTMALLVALIRGGLSVKLSFFRDFAAATALLAVVPYAFELTAEALVTPHLIPDFFGSAPQIAVWESASTWAPLSPSIVIPSMLQFVEEGLTEAGRVVLTGAPLEVSTALVCEGVLDGVLQAETAGRSSAVVLGHLPTFVIGSVLYGAAFALAFWVFVKGRGHARAAAALGAPSRTEHLFVFVMTALLCYTTSIDSVDVPWLIGFFACVCCSISTQYLLPALADEFCLQLKPVWYFAEGFLFILTGCVIRPAFENAQLAKSLFGNLLGVLLIGSLARMIGDVIVAVAWQWACSGSSPLSFTRRDWADVGRRAAFVWMATTPKATLQGTLGPKVAKSFQSAEKGKGASSPFAGPAVFVAPGAAVSILYMATLGSLLTFSAGKALAAHLQAHASGGGADPPRETELAKGFLARGDEEGDDGTTGSVMLLS